MPLEEKRNVVANLRSMEDQRNPPPKVCVEEADLDNKTVASFVTKNTENSWICWTSTKVPRRRSCHVGDEPHVPGRGKASTWPSRPNDPRGTRGRSCADFTKNPRTKSETSCNASFSCRRPPEMYPTAKKYGHCAT
ncbi:hypothetical protein GWK47_039012 [Chionoecetes opilio]|uniref:Uncharacterized protein n=1 Tax=Chionoecetes opilio TaxID=41210 RepID=A0A8J4YBZ4_CHIOP|nr:hypothetical protein GWK47_039012 [Chionoecetes opilio]